MVRIELPVFEQLCDFARRGILRSVRRLHREGADINERGADGRSAIWYAAGHQRYSVFKYLFDHDADLSPIGERTLLSEICTELSRLVAFSQIPLRDQLRCAQLLLTVDASGVHSRGSRDGGWATGETIAEATASRRNLALFELLLSHGANPDTVTRRGGTIMHRACMTSNRRLVSALVQHGGNYEMRDWRGYTPLMLCAFNTYRCRVAEVLLQAGADPMQLTRDGLTVTQLARRRGNHPMVCQLSNEMRNRAQARVKTEASLLALVPKMPEMIARVIGDYVHLPPGARPVRDGAHDRPTGGDPAAKRTRRE